MNPRNYPGLLDESWDHASVEHGAELPQMNDSSVSDTCLKEILLDKSILHSLCQTAFRENSVSNSRIATRASLGLALNYVCCKCQLDELDEDEIEEIWVSEMNFSEFYTVVLEMLTAIHRALHTDYN
jgi:hypothetical protein